MLTTTLQRLFARDLTRLRVEIETYRHEENLWRVVGELPNPGGNLALHLVGNLATYVGRELGGFPYERNRPLEFSARDVPRAEIVRRIDEVQEIVTRTLAALDATALEREYPVLVFDEPCTTEYLLVHLATHLTYHLGQVNYHRRVVDADPSP